MKKVIGVMPLYDDEKDSYWMIPGYMQMLEAQGAIPLMLPLTQEREELDYFLDTCDGFVLTGGQDVSPELYNEKAGKLCGTPCPTRDAMESYMLKRAIDEDKAVLGICRGIQFMNVCLGGTLYQDLPTEHPSSIEHHVTPPYDRTVHDVSIRRDTLLHDIINADTIGVNSYHHQAVKDLAGSLTAMAVSPDGLVEAVCMPDKKFVVGLQWHPELSYRSDENSKKIITAFLQI